MSDERARLTVLRYVLVDFLDRYRGVVNWRQALWSDCLLALSWVVPMPMKWSDSRGPRWLLMWRGEPMFLGLTTEQIARLSWQLGIGLRADERNLDRPVNTDPDAPGAEAPTLTAPATAPAMTLEELLGPEVEELIRVNKLP